MHQQGYIGRKMRLPELRREGAIVIAAFGSTRRARNALDIFTAELKRQFPDSAIYWAYTSEIIRRKLKLPSLQQTLAQLEADGYRRAVVQPLHIFPGTEYQQVAETCRYFPGLRVVLGETLCHRWDFGRGMMDGLEPEFLAPGEGLNLLALHGTPLAADPVNIVYLGLRHLVEELYPNVLAATVEGVPDHEALLARIRREGGAERYRRIRIFPFMYFAGLHAEEDLMGEADSWRSVLEGRGLFVDCPTVVVDGEERFKGLAYYPEVIAGFIARLKRALELLEAY